MSEQGLSAENSPAVAGPEQGDPGTVEQNSQPDIDWQKRYVDTQEAYTKGQQEIAELRQAQELYELLISSEDPDTRRQVALELGYQLEDDEEEQYSDDDEADPLTGYDQRLGRIEQSLTEREQDEADADYADQVREVLDERLAQLKLDEGDQDWVLAYAINALPITDEGLPDIEQAYEVFMQRETERQRNWAKTKRSPHISPHGQSGTEAPNLDDRQQRQDFVIRRLLEADQAS